MYFIRPVQSIVSYRTYIRFDQLDSSLTANENKFYFDYKDGKYGFNTDPNRGADTFNPFSGEPEYVQTGLSTYSSRVNIISGGYGIKDGWCYINIKLKANTSLRNSGIVYGFPTPKQGGYIGLNGCSDSYAYPCYLYKDSSLGYTIDASKNGDTISSGTEFTVIGKYEVLELQY